MAGMVVEFPTGLPFLRASPGRPGSRSVGGIVRSLSGHRRSVPVRGEPDEPLPIRLSELAGIADEIIDQLAVLVRDGVVTPASAARLAIRHAWERGGEHRRRLPESGATRYELTLAGDPFGRFAFRLRGRKAWIGFAPTSGYAFLSELCLHERVQACLLVGCSANRRTTVRLLTSVGWRRRLFRLGTGTCGTRHVLLLGGLTLREPERSSALAAIDAAIRRGGDTELVVSSLRRRTGVGQRVAIPDDARELLTMIELALPGLVDVASPVEESAP